MKTAKKYNPDLILHGNLIRAILSLAIPVVINSFLQTMYNLTDTYWLGKIGTEQLAAINLVTWDLPWSVPHCVFWEHPLSSTGWELTEELHIMQEFICGWSSGICPFYIWSTFFPQYIRHREIRCAPCSLIWEVLR